MSPRIAFELTFSGPTAVAHGRLAEQQLRDASVEAPAELARLHTIVAAGAIATSELDTARAAAVAARHAALGGDDIAAGWAHLASAIASVAPDAAARRVEDTRVALRIARDTGVEEYVRIAHFLHVSALAELGRITELDTAISTAGELLLDFPWLDVERHVAWFRCLRATIDGQADIAEHLAGEAYALAERAGDADATSVFVGQLAIIRWMQGRVVELEPEFLRARQAMPHEPIWAVSLAWMWLRQGRRSAARSLIAALPPVAALPPDRNWLATACLLATVVAELEETDRAGELLEVLRPYEHHLVMIRLGVTCWGTVARPLALLASALGDVDESIRHYRTALATAGRVGAHAWLAEAQSELATGLSARAEPGDADEALALAAEAVAAGRALGLYGVERLASTVLGSLQAAERATSHTASKVESDLPRISVLGAFEVIAADGSPARWRSRKARQLLKILIARRGAAISRESLMDLLWPDEAPATLANRCSVATTVVRRALDPHRAFPSDHYLQTVGGVLRLDVDRLDIDAERLLRDIPALLARPLDGTGTTRLVEVLELHRGEAFADEPGELWAEPLRREVQLAFFAGAHALAAHAAGVAEHMTSVECYRRILESDPYDQRAHEGLIAALERLGAHGQAAEAGREYTARMRELSIPGEVESVAAAG